MILLCKKNWRNKNRILLVTNPLDRTNTQTYKLAYWTHPRLIDPHVVAGDADRLLIWKGYPETQGGLRE